MPAPPRVRPHTSYLICATPRSGSGLLCEALGNSGLAGRPAAYFSGVGARRWFPGWEDAAFADYVEEVIARTTSPNGVFGVKVMWPHFMEFIQKVHQLPQFKRLSLSTPELLSTRIPNLHYIFIIRRDKVRQAVSLYRALQTGKWQWTQNKPAPRPPQAAFNFDLMHSLYINTVANEAAWQKYFVQYGIRPFQVVYEEFVESYEETTKALLHYLKIPVPPKFQQDERHLKKMADELNDAWCQAYHVMKRQKKPLSGASEQRASLASKTDQT